MCRTIRESCIIIWFQFPYLSTSSRRNDEIDFDEERYITLEISLKTELRQLNQLKSIVEMVDWIDERFVLRREGEEGYGETVSIDENRRN